jgi:hypothetical protein
VVPLKKSEQYELLFGTQYRFFVLGYVWDNSSSRKFGVGGAGH